MAITYVGMNEGEIKASPGDVVHNTTYTATITDGISSAGDTLVLIHGACDNWVTAESHSITIDGTGWSSATVFTSSTIPGGSWVELQMMTKTVEGGAPASYALSIVAGTNTWWDSGRWALLCYRNLPAIPSIGTMTSWGRPIAGGDEHELDGPHAANTLGPGEQLLIYAFVDGIELNSDAFFSFGALNEVQTVVLTSYDTAGDSFHLTKDGIETIAFVRNTNGTAAAIQAECRSVWGDSGILVDGTTNAGPFAITFSTHINETDVTVTNVSGCTGVIEQTQAGAADTSPSMNMRTSVAGPSRATDGCRGWLHVGDIIFNSGHNYPQKNYWKYFSDVPGFNGYDQCMMAVLFYGTAVAASGSGDYWGWQG